MRFSLYTCNLNVTLYINVHVVCMTGTNVWFAERKNANMLFWSLTNFLHCLVFIFSSVVFELAWLCNKKPLSHLIYCVLFWFLIIFSFPWQPSLFRPAILSELWARKYFIAIPPAALWPGSPGHHQHHHHKRNHFIIGTPAAAARAWHLSLSLSPPPQPALQPECKTFMFHVYRQRWRLITGQRAKKEHFQSELGGEASESRAAQSGSLGDDGPPWGREREAVRLGLKVWWGLFPSYSVIHRSDFASSHVILTVQFRAPQLRSFNNRSHRMC